MLKIGHQVNEMVGQAAVMMLTRIRRGLGNGSEKRVTIENRKLIKGDTPTLILLNNLSHHWMGQKASKHVKAGSRRT